MQSRSSFISLFEPLECAVLYLLPWRVERDGHGLGAHCHYHGPPQAGFAKQQCYAPPSQTASTRTSPSLLSRVCGATCPHCSLHILDEPGNEVNSVFAAECQVSVVSVMIQLSSTPRCPKWTKPKSLDQVHHRLWSRRTPQCSSIAMTMAVEWSSQLQAMSVNN